MPIPPVEPMEVRILMSATAVDNSTLTNDVASQDVPDVIDPTAIDPTAIDPTVIDSTVIDSTAIDSTAIDSTAIDGTAIDGKGDDILNGGSPDGVPVDDFGNAYLQRTVGNELPVGKQFDKNLFPTDGYGGHVIFTMGLNPAGTNQETSDTGTTSDWTSNSDGNSLIEGGNPDDLLLSSVDPVVCDFLPRDVGNDVSEGGDGNDILSAETWGGVQNFGDPVPMMFQAGAGQPADFGNAAADAGNSSGLETLNGGTDDSLLLSGLGNDALKGFSSQYNLVRSTGTNLPFGGTGGDLMVSGSNRSEGDLRGLWLLFTDSTQATPYETPVDQLGNTRGGTNIGFVPNSTAVSDEFKVDNLMQETWTDWYFATSLQDGLADTAVDEFFTRIDSHL